MLGTTSAVATDPRIGLPVATAAFIGTDTFPIGFAVYRDTGSSYKTGSLFTIGSAIEARPVLYDGTNLSAVAPITWGSTDVMAFQFGYEPA